MTRITSELVGMPYELGTMDCFMLVVKYLRKVGIDPPEQFGDLTLSTYKELYQKEPERAVQIMIRYIHSFLHEVAVTKTKAGDILLLKALNNSRLMFPAINGGNANVVLVIPDRGVSVMSLRYYRAIRGWSWEPLYRL